VLQGDRDGAQRVGWRTKVLGSNIHKYVWVGEGEKWGQTRLQCVLCGFVYCKEVTGGRKRRGRGLGTHGKSETNKEQKEGRQKEDRKCERKIKLQTKVQEQKSKRNMNRTQGGVWRHGGMMLQVRNFVGGWRHCFA